MTSDNQTISYLDVIGSEEDIADIQDLVKNFKDVKISDSDVFSPTDSEFSGAEVVIGLKIVVLCISGAAATVKLLNELHRYRNRSPSLFVRPNETN